MQDYPGGTVIEPDNPSLRYIGHWDKTRLAEEAITVNSGSRILASFTGHTLRGLFSTEGITHPAQIYVSVDGARPLLFTLDSPVGNFTPQRLKGNKHTLQLAVKDVDERADRWVPPLASAAVFKGLLLDRGARMLPPKSPAGSLRMEFYGDSITQGVRVLSMQIGTQGSDGTKDYAFLTGMAFDGLFNQVGFGRQGVIRTGNGEVPPAPHSFGWNFQGSRADASFIPQVVVINQGTNDHPYSSSEFEPAYQSYIQEIRTAYPRAFLLCMRPFGGFHEADIRAAVLSLRDPRILYVDTTGWLDKSDFTDGVHPNAGGHIKAARKLIAFVQAHTRLKPARKLEQPWWK
ncbi:MAG: GDSL-type esterase/lipase family protein [Terriglobia bacterium]